MLSLRSAFLLSLLLFTSAVARSQSVTRHYVDSTLSSKFKNYKTQRGVFYVVDGVVYDSVRVDTVLRRFDRSEIVGLHFLSCDKAMFCHCSDDIAIASFVYAQNKKAKRKELEEAEKLFDGCLWPTISVDNVMINPDDPVKMIRSLKLKDIRYIEVTETVYPQIRIWLLHKK